LVGRKDTIERLIEEIEVEADVQIIDLKSEEEEYRKHKYAKV